MNKNNKQFKTLDEQFSIIYLLSFFWFPIEFGTDFFLADFGDSASEFMFPMVVLALSASFGDMVVL